LIEYKFRGAAEDNDLWQADHTLYRARLNEAKAKMEMMREAYAEDLSLRDAFVKARKEYTELLHATRLSFSRTTPYFETDH
jgi:5-bromo-4-chloroindolyl phosphate hydrolysis protein